MNLIITLARVGGGYSAYSQPHLIGTWLIGSSGSDQDFSPDKPLL